MQANIPSSYYFVPGNVPDSSQYLQAKKCSEIYLGQNKRKKSKKKIYYSNNNQNVLCYNIGRAYTLNYPASSNNVIIANNLITGNSLLPGNNLFNYRGRLI